MIISGRLIDGAPSIRATQECLCDNDLDRAVSRISGQRPDRAAIVEEANDVILATVGYEDRIGGEYVGEVMTIEEIHERFVSEWVLIQDPQLADSLKVLGGKVLWHSKSRNSVYKKALELRPRSSAFVFTGRIPLDAAIVL